MFEVGRLCIKIAGRDAGLKCVVVDVLDSNYVLIDGETRRRKCNVDHLEPLKDVVKIEKNASHEDVKKAFEGVGLKARETKPKKAAPKPLAKRKTHEQLRAQKEAKMKVKESVKKKSAEKKPEAVGELEGKLGVEKDEESKSEENSDIVEKSAKGSKPKKPRVKDEKDIT